MAGVGATCALSPRPVVKRLVFVSVWCVIAIVAAVGARWDWFCEGQGGGSRDSHPWAQTHRDIFLDSVV